MKSGRVGASGKWDLSAHSSVFARTPAVTLTVKYQGETRLTKEANEETNDNCLNWNV